MNRLPRKSSADVLATLAEDALLHQQYRTLIRLPEYAWLVNGPAWWTVKEVAVGLGVGPATIRHACERRELPGSLHHGHRVGWRIPFSSLIPWLMAHHERKGGSSPSIS